MQEFRKWSTVTYGPTAAKGISMDNHLLMNRDDPEKLIADLERQQAGAVNGSVGSAVPGAPGFGRQAGLRERWRLARGMAKVTDPDGVRWTVYRRWFPNWNLPDLSGADLGEATPYIFGVIWAPWFIAKWLGVRWIILIERNGGEVGDERVRGWRKSQRRIKEIAESAAAGTLQKELAGIRRPKTKMTSET